MLFKHFVALISTFHKIVFFSSPEPKAQGELIGWESSGRSSIRPSICPNFQT